jgi:hypothetical protein
LRYWFFLTTFPFLFEFLTDYFVQSSGLIDQSIQTAVTDSDRGLVLEPIQEIPADDILVESSEQPGPDITKNLGDDVFTPSVEQLDIQRTDASDALANQPRHSSDPADLQTRQPTKV